MKTILILLCAAVLAVTSHAGEFVTLNAGKTSVALQATDVVQVVGIFQNNSPASCNFVFASGGQTSTLPIPGTSSSGGVPTQFTNLVITGLSQVSIPAGSGSLAVTLHITKTNEGFVSESLVVPLAPGTTFAVALETSTDMQIWVPANPGNYVSSSTARFFRVKAAVSPAAP